MNSNNGELWIILELMNKGTLTDVLKELKQFMDLELILRIARDVCSGMAWIHSLNLIHRFQHRVQTLTMNRDLKSQNLLVPRVGTH